MVMHMLVNFLSMFCSLLFSTAILRHAEVNVEQLP
ncbi:hypothetical protein T4D_13174 [Trichinella pseudospiralis]|uniref:Uncharacterized protein n=1 Tax=Trichinella pseudospiralis TaxID=6337 RepID=A0A0V1G5V6_TRIPS|nr:hypothetical protein T4D_13174 [Trichinella pseudospiralis]